MKKSATYTDDELISGCLKNDRKYQELLYKKYFGRMMQMCYKYTSDRDIAMEIVNDGMLRVFKKVGKYSFKGSFEGWMRKLVFHSLSDYFKKHNKYVHFMVFEEKEKAINAEPLNNLYWDDLLNLIDKLPDNTKKVFQLYAIEGFAHKEIAKTLSISEGTSKWHLSNARKLLQDLIYNNNKTMQYAQ